MLKAPIKWGILGTSYISEVMANAIQESQTSELVAIGSRSLTSAKHFSNKFSIPRFYSDYQQLINDNDIDVIYLGLPNHLHKEWILRCAAVGKHILCEKPFVISIDEAQEVISTIEKSKVFCLEALMYRYHPLTIKLQELIQSKVIGDIKLYNAIYTANIAAIANPLEGGSIRNLGCYPISLIRLLEGREPTQIHGKGRVNSGNKTDNQASVILKFEEGAMAVVSTADDIEMFWQFDVYGTKGHLKVLTNPWLPGDDNKILISFNDSPATEINVSAEKSLYTYQIDFVNKQIIRKDIHAQRNKISLMDSLGNTQVLEAWRQQVGGN